MVIAHPELSLAIGGSRDEIAAAASDAASTTKLSTDSFSAAARYLVERGVKPSRIAVQGYGDQRAARRSLTSADRPANRRIEITLFRESAAAAIDSEAQP